METLLHIACGIIIGSLAFTLRQLMLATIKKLEAEEEWYERS